MKVIIASNNLAKIEAVQSGFERVFPDEKITFEGISTESGVSNQPMTDAETLQGAMNRVNNASELRPADVDYWVGLEGGIEVLPNHMIANFAWIVVKSQDGIYGQAKTSTYMLPTKIAELIHEGRTLQEADAAIFLRNNIAPSTEGTIGALTQGEITRAIYYETTVVLALLPFTNKNIY